MTARADYIAGLRAIADALEADENLPLPHHGTNWSSELIFCETRDQIAAWARVMTGEKRKHIGEDSDYYGFELHGQVHGFHVQVCVKRAEVCRRVVKGTRTEVKVEQITQVIGERRVPVTVEDVEWVCEPLLAEVAS